MRAVLVYQNGIANVFKVDCFNLSKYGREAKRLLQCDFRACEYFASGLRAAGWTVKVAYCDDYGDISKQPWIEAQEANRLSACT